MRGADSKASTSSLSRARRLHGSEVSLTRRPATSSAWPSCPAVQKAKAGVQACIEQMKSERNLHDARYTFSGLLRPSKPLKRDVRWVVGQLQSLSEDLTELIREEQRSLKQKPLPKIKKTDDRKQDDKQIKRQNTAPATSRKEPPPTPKRNHPPTPHKDPSSIHQKDPQNNPPQNNPPRNDPSQRDPPSNVKKDPVDVPKRESLPASKLKVPSPPKQRPRKKKNNDELISLMSNFFPLQRQERLLSQGGRYRDVRSQTGFPALCTSNDDSSDRIALALRRTEQLIERLNAIADDLGFRDDDFGEGLLHVLRNFDV